MQQSPFTQLVKILPTFTELEYLLLHSEHSTTNPQMGQINVVYIITLQFFRVHFIIIHTNNHH
jgi:hypothetical protein